MHISESIWIKKLSNVGHLWILLKQIQDVHSQLLERESAIKVTRRKKYSNVYEFTKLTEDFERITLKFLSKTEWTPETKGYIMGYLAQAYKDPVTEYAYHKKNLRHQWTLL